MNVLENVDHNRRRESCKQLTGDLLRIDSYSFGLNVAHRRSYNAVGFGLTMSLRWLNRWSKGE
jgi:hypothetical protein